MCKVGVGVGVDVGQNPRGLHRSKASDKGPKDQGHVKEEKL